MCARGAELTSLPAMEQEWQGPAKCYFLPLSGKLRLESADASQQTPPTAKSCERPEPTSYHTCPTAHARLELVSRISMLSLSLTCILRCAHHSQA